MRVPTLNTTPDAPGSEIVFHLIVQLDREALNALGSVAAVVGVAVACVPLILARGRRTMLRRRITQSLEMRALLPSEPQELVELARVLTVVACGASEELVRIETRWVVYRPFRVLLFRFACVLGPFIGISLALGRFSSPERPWWVMDLLFGVVLVAWVGPAATRASKIASAMLEGVRTAWRERRTR